MSVILLVDGLLDLYVGTAGWGQVMQIEPIPSEKLNPFFRTRQIVDLSQPGSWQYSEAKIEILTYHLRERLSSARQADAAASGTTRPPRLLPYLTDRSEQRRRLVFEVQRQIDGFAAKPLAFLVVGSEDQCVDSFAEQVRYVTLPDLLGANGLPSQVRFPMIDWPTTESTIYSTPSETAQRFEDLMTQVRSALGLRMTAPLSAIERAISESGQCCCFHFSLSLDDWDIAHTELLRQWVGWWSNLALSSSKLPLLTLVSVVYPRGWIAALVRRKAIVRLVKDVLGVAVADMHVLPELENVRWRDVDAWIKEQVEDVDREVLRRKLARHFLWPLGRVTRRLPMYDAAAVVKAALKDPEVRIAKI